MVEQEVLQSFILIYRWVPSVRNVQFVFWSIIGSSRHIFALCGMVVDWPKEKRYLPGGAVLGTLVSCHPQYNYHPFYSVKKLVSFGVSLMDLSLSGVRSNFSWL